MPKRIEPIHRRNGKVIVVRGEVSKAKSRVELAKYRSCTEENWTNETPHRNHWFPQLAQDSP